MDSHANKDNNPRKALGRGLAALIPQASATQPSQAGLRTIPIERIRPNRRQPRKVFEDAALTELAESIEARGVLQPIVVRKAGEEYEIVAGERRWRAAAKAGLHEIPAIVKDLSDSDAIQVALIENIQRQDLDPLEEAEAYSRLIRDYGLNQDQVAEAVGKSRSAIANSLRLVRLPQAVLQMLADGRLTAGHARALMSLEQADAITQLAQSIVERSMSVRDVERQVRLMTQKPKAKQKAGSPAELAVEERLQRAFSTKVRLRNRNGKGRIELFFHSLEHLQSLLDRLAP